MIEHVICPVCHTEYYYDYGDNYSRSESLSICPHCKSIFSRDLRTVLEYEKSRQW